MSRQMVVNFPAASTTALMPVTDVEAGVTLANTTIFSKAYKIAITGTGNVSGNTFTITGTDVNGASINETITGGTANVPSVTTAQFKSVTSIISKTAGVPAAVNNVKAGVVDLIALSQPIANGSAAILNVGDNAAFTFTPSPTTVFNISLSSTANISGVNFTISGTDNTGAPSNEVLAGPNATTVFSANTYNSIISITPDAAVTNMKAGSQVYIAALQNTGVTGAFVLAHTTFPSQEWTLSVSSPNDLSDTQLEIIGTDLAGASTEFLVGPNADTVESVNNYSTVSSITVNASADDVTINVPHYIAPTQDIVGTANAILQQNVVKFPTATAYNVTLSSAGDNSGSSFTITGTDINGGAQNEVVTGPNADTVVSVNAYNSITSIAPDAGATAISAGAYGFIADTQDTTAETTSTLPLTQSLPILLPNVQRKINFTSVPDNSGVTITIVGEDFYGNVFTETLTGPNNSTVTSAYPYHIITDISTDGDFFGMSIGWDSVGVLQWLQLNTMATFPSTTIEVIKSGTITYSVNQTLNKIDSYVPTGPTYKYLIPTAMLLGNNPLTTINASAVVTVTTPTPHGLQTFDLVTIQGAAATNNISAANLNITSQITVISATSFSFVAGAVANNTPAGGGAAVYYYFPALPTPFAVVAALTNATTNQIYTLTTAASALQASVTASSAGGNLTMTVLQQGIN